MWTKSDRDDAIAELRRILRPGDKVTTHVVHVARSGMSRQIVCECIDKSNPDDPIVRDITALVAKATGNPLNRKHWGVKVSGCGMDMCFALIYELGSVLFPDGFGVESRRLDGDYNVIARRRPASRDEAAQMLLEGWKFSGRNGDSSGWDNSGGYALRY